MPPSRFSVEVSLESQVWAKSTNPQSHDNITKLSIKVSRENGASTVEKREDEQVFIFG